MERGKKGSSHVGFILSFVIFVMFVMFIFVILNGQDRGTKSEKDFVLSALSDKLIENATTELTSVSLKVRDGDIKASGDCDSGAAVDKIKFDSSNIGEMDMDLDGDLDVVVKRDIYSSDYNIVGGADKKLLLKWNNAWIGNERYFKIYKSTYFSTPGYSFGGGPACTATSTNNVYSLGQVGTNKYVYLGLIDNMVTKYKTDYESLKKELFVPEGNDFYFRFDYEGAAGTTLTKSPGENYAGLNEPPQASEIFSEKYNVLYFDNQAIIKPGYFTIEVW
ncbi:hypothetical protein COU57_07025 [Candidatus Pacearchaeota archaeon CG10_big_fil_rev_8_21_14_0_10_32_14]|nr:MAG: hypothetical protein COU57_07025 [Candidatus Pacearchaeota archaeon CG10_big_fil_rev_8_21_14_0_10_32_14]